MCASVHLNTVYFTIQQKINLKRATFVEAHNIKAVVHKSKYVWNAHKEVRVVTHPHFSCCGDFS